MSFSSPDTPRATPVTHPRENAVSYDIIACRAELVSYLVYAGRGNFTGPGDDEGHDPISDIRLLIPCPRVPSPVVIHDPKERTNEGDTVGQRCLGGGELYRRLRE